MLRTLVMITVLFGLLGCGNVDSGPSFGGALLGRLKGAVAAAPSASKTASQMTRARFAKQDKAVIIATIASRKAQASLFELRKNGATTTWLTGDGVSLLIQGAVMSGTRGLGHDLMSADVVQVRQALATGGGTAQRAMWSLDGEDQSIRQEYTCQITGQGSETIQILGREHKTTKFQEQCIGDGQSFKNLYWKTGDIVWKSSQWISPELKHVVIEKIQ